MRLTTAQAAAIRKAAIDTFGEPVGVWLFGSRTDDAKRGGDIDLLIQPRPELIGQAVQLKIRLLGELEKALGERKIDIVIEGPDDPRPIVRIAHQTGIRL